MMRCFQSDQWSKLACYGVHIYTVAWPSGADERYFSFADLAPERPSLPTQLKACARFGDNKLLGIDDVPLEYSLYGKVTFAEGISLQTHRHPRQGLAGSSTELSTRLRSGLPNNYLLSKVFPICNNHILGERYLLKHPII
jgi:hypothetical protein